jgi:hypothetical protein
LTTDTYIAIFAADLNQSRHVAFLFRVGSFGVRPGQAIFDHVRQAVWMLQLVYGLSRSG